MELTLITPEDPHYAEELDLRYRILRAPLGMPRGSELFPYEAESLHLVAIDGGHVVGCVLFHPRGTERGRLFQMAVDEDRQGGGLGRQLVEHLERELSIRGFSEVFLHARGHVLGFYERLGYQLYGEPFEEVGIPHRSMRKRIAPEAATA